jgi:hypothetical protein
MSPVEAIAHRDMCWDPLSIDSNGHNATTKRSISRDCTSRRYREDNDEAEQYSRDHHHMDTFSLEYQSNESIRPYKRQKRDRDDLHRKAVDVGI